MSKLSEIKKRIVGIGEIKGITNAMKLVAVVRLKKIEEKALSGRSYTQKIKDLLLIVQKEYAVINRNSNKHNNTKGLIIITSQGGLCGGFNSRIIQKSEHFLKSHPCQLIVLGKKGIPYFKNKGHQVIKEYAKPKEKELTNVSQEISKNILSFYLENKWKEVYLIYYKFKIEILDTIFLVKLLPLVDNSKQKKSKFSKNKFLFEPLPEEIIENLFTEYISSQIRQALLESSCSEELERIKAMDYAANNADKIVEEYTQQFNRARQTAITRELYG